MIINKDIEIETSDFRDSDLIQELESRIENKYILFNEDAQKIAQPDVDAMLEKLKEIRVYLLGF